MRRLEEGENPLNISARIGTKRASVACFMTSTGVTLLPAAAAYIAAADCNQQSAC